jgi:hypothetical protein
MSESADPLVVTVMQWLVLPARSMSDQMVVAAEGGKIVGAGGSAICKLNTVVEIAVGGRHSAAGEDAGAVAVFDVPALTRGGSPAGDAVVKDLACVRAGDGPPPLGIWLLLSDLTGDVGDDRAVAGEFARVIGEPGQRF